MNHCKDCWYWGNDERTERWWIAEDDLHRVCRRVREDIGDDTAKVVAVEDGDLITTGQFGCVLFSAVETEEGS